MNSICHQRLNAELNPHHYSNKETTLYYSEVSVLIQSREISPLADFPSALSQIEKDLLFFLLYILTVDSGESQPGNYRVTNVG